MQEITSACAEQRTGVGQINKAMTQMSQITQQNASSSEELAATAEEMMGQTSHLREMMQFFRTSEHSRSGSRGSVGRSAPTAVATRSPRVPPQVKKRADLPATLDDSQFDRF